MSDLLSIERVFFEDATMGLLFFMIAVYTFFRTLTFIHLKGKGNYVIKAFHFLIAITAVLRCVWFWRAPNAYIYLLNSTATETPGEFLSQSLNTLGTVSLFSSFLILSCYWSYMLEHVTLKTNVEPDCFVPTHMLPLEYQSNLRPTRFCECSITVIEIYLFVMKALACAGFASLVAWLSGRATNFEFVLTQSSIEGIASIACIVTLSILSGRIRMLLKTYGGGNPPSIEQHISRIVTVTIGVNSFLVFRMAISAGFLYVTTSQSQTALEICSNKLYWDLYIAFKYGAEVVVLLVELVVSRILQEKQKPSDPTTPPRSLRYAESNLDAQIDVEMSAMGLGAASGRGSEQGAEIREYASITTPSSSKKFLAASSSSKSITNASASESTPLISARLSKMAVKFSTLSPVKQASLTNLSSSSKKGIPTRPSPPPAPLQTP